MKDKQNNKIVTTHKEEAPGRIASGTTDRQKIHDALQSYIDPFATDNHPPAVLNIVACLNVTDKVLMNRSKLEENRWRNLTMDGQPASIRQ